MLNFPFLLLRHTFCQISLQQSRGQNCKFIHCTQHHFHNPLGGGRGGEGGGGGRGGRDRGERRRGRRRRRRWEGERDVDDDGMWGQLRSKEFYIQNSPINIVFTHSPIDLYNRAHLYAFIVCPFVRYKLARCMHADYSSEHLPYLYIQLYLKTY